MLLAAMLMIGCARQPEPTPAEWFPDPRDVPGWRLSGERQRYTRENLFDYMDGEAEMYFLYGFQEMQVQEYAAREGGPIRVEIYEVDSDENAYGLFTYYRGGQLLEVGNEGDMALGGRLSFWQGRHFARVFPIKDVEEGILEAFARHVASALPLGGAPPDLVGKLPSEKLAARSERFFHQKLALDNIIWTVDENVLNLGAETDAVAAEYDYGGVSVTLLIVAYPGAEAAGAAGRNLEATNMETLSAAGQRGHYVVAVFEAPDQDEANDLLQRALELLETPSG